MSDRLVPIAEGFWNLRGTFKFKGLLNIGTHMSLARLSDGGFVVLDAYTLEGDLKDEVLGLTDGGAAIRAVLHLHPFHTVFVRSLHDLLPHAKLYGTARHHDTLADLPWQPERTEDPACHALFADDFAFSVPRGVHLVPDDPNLHFSSVLALHRASGALHVDDTLSYLKVPLLGGAVRFHPTLKKTLEERPSAVADFRAWAQELVALGPDVRHLCTAHGPTLPPQPSQDGAPFAEVVQEALSQVEGVLSAHEKRHG